MPSNSSGFFSFVAVSWMTGLMWKAFRHGLTEDDLYDLQVGSKVIINPKGLSDSSSPPCYFIKYFHGSGYVLVNDLMIGDYWLGQNEEECFHALVQTVRYAFAARSVGSVLAIFI
jgi:hypothetical protein